MNEKTKTVIVTGGHLTPALATVEAMHASYPMVRVVWVGRKVALEGSGVVSEEYRVVTQKGIPFYAINAGRIKRDASVLGLFSGFKIPFGFLQALVILLRIRPDAVLSFGGYVAFPVVLAAWVLRTPVVTHEQTTNPGLANKIISRFADRICVTFPKTAQLFGQPVVVTGLPIRKRMLHPVKKAPFETGSAPILFITGGSTGSVSINTIIYKALPTILRHFVVVHQVGALTIDQAQQIKGQLPRDTRDRYMPVAYLDEDAYSWVIQNAHMVLGRSGANTVVEMALLGKVGLFVPLPWASGNEQYTNAQFLVDAGSAVIVDQKSFTVDTLTSALSGIMTDYTRMKSHAKKFALTIPSDGAHRVAREVAHILAI